MTLATVECADELALMHDSLRAFHSPQEVPVVVGCSSELLHFMEQENGTNERSGKKYEALLSDPTIHWIPCLDQYGKINRQKMERERGIWYPTKHCDFMMEKANVMEFALHRMANNDNKNEQVLLSPSLPPGVLYVDSDITFFDSLYSMFNSSSHSSCSSSSLADSFSPPILGVSPHFISELDERLFGRYNGGMIFAAHPVVIWHWKAATPRSRYFDQASIEDVYDRIVETEGRNSICEFGPQVNYGFWRMFQSRKQSIEEEVKQFSLNGNKILYEGKALQSVHTHWFMPTQCREIPVFNKLLRRWVQRIRLTSPSMYKGLLRAM